MKNKQTAVEWLKEQYYASYTLEDTDFSKAKEMEKEQIKDAWMDGMEGILHEIAAEEYYQETYGKQSTDVTKNE